MSDERNSMDLMVRKIHMNFESQATAKQKIENSL